MKQTRPSARVAFAALRRPSVDALPEPSAPIRWTGWRWVLLGVALLCSTYFFATVIEASWQSMQGLLELRDKPLEITSPTDAKSIEHAFWENVRLVLAGVTVMLCLWGIAGKQAAGLSGGLKRYSIGLGYYMRTVYPGSLVALTIMSLLLSFLPVLNNRSITRNGHATGLQSGEIFLSFAAGITEEVIGIVFVYWLLERIRMRCGATLAATGWGTAAIIVMQLSYHTYYGVIGLWMVVATYFTIICWRYTRNVFALMIGHIGWDLILMTPGRWPTIIALGLAAVGCWLDWQAVRPTVKYMS